MNARRALVVALFACVGSAWAEDNVLLIQNAPQGFVVWHSEGESNLPDDSILEIMATATPDGGDPVSTELGRAQAYEQEAGILIRLPDARSDRAWLVDRDACGHIKLWHAEGQTQLSETELTDIVLSALPEGGPRLHIGQRYAKAFLGKLGVTVTLWNAPKKK